MSKKKWLQHNIPFTCACAVYLIFSLWGEGRDQFENTAFQTKRNSNKDGEKGRDSRVVERFFFFNWSILSLRKNPQQTLSLLPQIQELPLEIPAKQECTRADLENVGLACQTGAMHSEELKASLGLLLLTWTLQAGSVKSRKANEITICTNTHMLMDIKLI